MKRKERGEWELKVMDQRVKDRGVSAEAERSKDSGVQKISMEIIIIEKERTEK